MPIDDRIPDALGRAAGALPKTAGDWDDVRSRAVARRRRRRGEAGLALAAVAVLVVGFVFATGDDDRSVVTAPSASSEVVAAIDNTLVVLSADDGDMIRTLATAPFKRTIGRLTTSPDGSTVYYSLIDSCDLPTEIWSVPSGGGTPQQVAFGGLPLVSPDGRWLAFAERVPLDHPCLYDVELIVRDLTTNQELTFATPGPSLVEPVAWAPDSTQLVVRRMGSDVERPLDVTLEVLPSGIRELSAVDNQVLAYEFLPSGEPVTAFPAGNTSSTIDTFDPATEVGGGRTVLKIDSAGLSDLLDVDATGSKFLLAQLSNDEGGADLYRAELGDPDPTKIAEHVKDAVWLPAPPRREGEIVAKIVDNGVPKIVILSAADGHVLREVSADPVLANWGAVSVSSDGRAAYITIGEPDPPTETCGSDIEMTSVVARIELSDGTITPVLRASGSAIVSPDGRRLAYVAGLGGCTVLPDDRNPTLGVLDLTSGDGARPYEGRDPRIVQPIAWASDGSRLLTGGPSGDNQTASYLVVDRFPLDRDPTEIDPPQRFITGTYLSDGRLVVAYALEDPQRLATDPLGTYHVAVVDDRGEVTEQLFETKANLHIERIDADESGRMLVMTQFGGLAVWTPGDDAPRVLIAAGAGPIEVQGAEWLPASPAPSPAPTTSTTTPTERPDSIFAVQGAQLAKLAPLDGERMDIVLDSLSTRAFENALSMNADGTKAVVTGIAAAPCPRYGPEMEDRGGLALIDLETGSTGPIDLGDDVHSALTPSLSPDGTRVAYIADTCEAGGRHVVVRDLAAGAAEIPFDQSDGADPGTIAGWDADGRLLVGFYAADHRSAEWRFIDTESGAVTTVGPMQLASMPGLPEQLVPLGTTGRWAASREESDHGRRIVNVYEYDLATGERGAVLLAWRDFDEFAGPAHLVASDPSGRHLLLLAERKFSSGAGTAYQLYRWSEGDDSPTKVTEVVTAADW